VPDSTLNEIFEELFTRVRIAKPSEYASSSRRAYNVMKRFDEKDSPFLALALHLDSSIWSNDKHLRQQKLVRTYTTLELAILLGIVGKSESQ
jgi:predicted nucleic acid-binding protein